MVFSAGSSSLLESTILPRPETPGRTESPPSFSGTSILLRIFQGNEAGERGGLGELISSGRARNFSEAFEQLNPGDRETLRRSWGRSLEELASLGHERNPQLFYTGLLQLGERLEDRGQIDLAGMVYTVLVDSPLEAISQRAQGRLDAINGVGDVGARIGFLARRMAQDVTEPTPILAMGAAGAAFRLTRFATLGRLALSPTASFLTRPLVARSLANLLGFGAEVLAFSAAGRAGNAVLGREQAWSAHALGQELASGAIFLGCLKVAGGLSQGLAGSLAPRALPGRVVEQGAMTQLGQFLLPQVGTLGGILVSHRVETALGLREELPGATSLVDSLALLVQLHAAGRLTQGVLGEGFQHLERDLDQRTEWLGRSFESHSDSVFAAEMLTPEGMSLPVSSDPSFPTTPSSPLGAVPGTRPERGRSGGEPPIPPRPPGGGSSGGPPSPSDPELEAVRRRGRQFAVRLALDDFRHADRISDPAFAEQALDSLRTEIEMARQELIGRDFNFLSPARWDQLYERVFEVPGFEVKTRPEIRRVLIANRGEIAIRLARTFLSEGVTPYFTASSSDLSMGWVREMRSMGAKMVAIGGETPRDSYLHIPRVLSAANRMGVDAIHPGYGYLSENVSFGEAARQQGFVFLGPSVETMRLTGDKDAFKRAATQAGVPVVPGTDRGYEQVEPVIAELEQLGLIAEGELIQPVRLKAVGGGGGRGQRTVRNLAEMRRVFPILTAEARSAFGDPRVMAELAVERFQHLEFQVLGDRFGNIVSLGERECTPQERNQKLLEFHPARLYERFPGLRERMEAAAMQAARAVHYSGHGTVEFLVNPDSGDFFAMEVNARIQVEHRVTEAVTGIDLVAEQLRVARGLPLAFRQEEIRPRGAAVEVRIKGVDSSHRDKEGNPVSVPEAGAVLRTFSYPAGPGIFMERSVWPGDTFSRHADPMIAKLIVTGQTLPEAIGRAIRVLEQTRIEGEGPAGSKRPLRTDLERQLRLLRTRAVADGSYDNRFVDEFMRRGGEDQTRFSHATGTKLEERLPSPVFLKVVSPQEFSAERMESFSEPLRALLRGMRRDSSELSGPLADFLRSQPALLERRNSGRRGNSPRLQVEIEASGELRHVLIYEGTRLTRVLMASRVSSGNDRVWDPVVYEIRFSRNGEAPEARLFRQALNASFLAPEHSTVAFPSPGQRGSLIFFPETAGELRAQYVRSSSVSALTLRDVDGNLTLRRSSLEITADLGPRIQGLIEILRTELPSDRRQEAFADFLETLRSLAAMDSEHPIRQAAVEHLGTTPQSVVQELSEAAAQGGDPRVHALVDEIVARRELQRHSFVSYKHLDPRTAAVRFTETDAQGQKIPRLMIRTLLETRPASPHLLLLDYRETLERAQRYLRDLLQDSELAASNNVIQVWIPRSREIQATLNPEFLMQAVRTALGQGREDYRSDDLQEVDLRLKRVTFGVFGGGEYPYYYTYRRGVSSEGERNGLFEEDLRYRGIHPQVANSLLEIPRLDLFEVERDSLSDRFQHLYYARNRQARDFRLFGMGIVPHAEVIPRSRNAIEIPALEEALSRLAGAMEVSLRGRPEEARPTWNRLFLNVQPVLAVTQSDLLRYLEQTLNGRWEHQTLEGRSRRVLTGGYLDQLTGLNLEKVVLRARLRDSRMPCGYRDVLIRLSNPTGFRYEGQIQSIVRSPVREGEGSVREREVLIEAPAFQRWLRRETESEFVLQSSEWQPADIPIRPATREEIREAQSRARGALWAYRIPALISDVAESFLVENALGRPRPSELRSREHHDTRFIELDLLPDSTRIHPRTGALDPNFGDLGQARQDGRWRPPGLNRAGLVIGEHVVDLGLRDQAGAPLHVRRLLIMGDLTHSPSRGSLSEEECARINAALRYAQRFRIPIDWFVASSGAQITREKGVENLEATASAFRDIVLNTVENRRRLNEAVVPINFIIPDYSIGAMSYYIAVGAIAQQTRGTVIMVSPPAVSDSGTPRRAAGSMGLTGDLAMTANFRGNLSFRKLRQEAERMYPLGNRSIAGYELIHGPNGEAMAVAPDLRSAVETLMGYHYFTYAPNGELAGARPRLERDPVDRDITLERSASGRGIGEEIEALRRGGKYDFLSILNALRDRGSPEPVVLWRQDFQPSELPENLRRQLPVRLPKALVAFTQLGGHPVEVVHLAAPISPADAERMARAIHLVNERVPLLFIGSWPGFWSDSVDMAARQLTHGGALGAAMVLRRGPTLIANLQFSVGGAKVIVAKNLRAPEEQDQHRIIALRGAREQVIGGISVENVIFGKEHLGSARQDPRVRAAEEALRTARSEADRGHAQQVYDSALESAIWEIIRDRAASFDAFHSVERAHQVGSVDRIVDPAELRPALIQELETALNAYHEWRVRRLREEREERVVELVSVDNEELLADLIRGLTNSGSDEAPRDRARSLARGLLEFAGPEPESPAGGEGENPP